MKLTKKLKKILDECKVRIQCDHCSTLTPVLYETRLGFKLCRVCFLEMYENTKETTKELRAHRHIKLHVGCAPPPQPSRDSRKRRWVVPKGRRLA